MNYLVTGTLTHSFNWWVCECERAPEVLAWGGAVSLTPTAWEINVAPLPSVTWLKVGDAPRLEDGGVWFQAIDAGGARATFAGTTVTYHYEAHHGDRWEAQGTLAPVPEPSILALMLIGVATLVWKRRGL